MKFSVIMPAYNAAEYIGTALSSVLSQTCQDFEIVVVDDGSTDETADIVRRLEKSDHRVTLLSHSSSRGPSAARNTAIEHASGEWLALLDSDDAFYPGRLETLLAIAETRSLDAVADGLKLVEFSSGKDLGIAFDPAWLSTPYPITLPYLLARDWPGRYRCWSFGTMKPIFRRQIVVENKLRYDEDLRLGEDLLFYADLFLAGARFGVTDQCLYSYSVRTGSISARPMPTDQLVVVNRRIRTRLKTTDIKTSCNDILLEMLIKRENALWFQLFTWYFRVRMLKESMKAFQQMPPLFVLQQGFNRIQSRLWPRG